jgi:hypothetical protein
MEKNNTTISKRKAYHKTSQLLCENISGSFYNDREEGVRLFLWYLMVFHSD